MYNIYIYVTIIYTHPNVSWNHQSVSQDHPSPPAQNPHQISKPCHKISENHLKSSGRKKRQKLPSTKDLREALHLLGFEEITEPRETQPSEKSEKEKALGCKKGSMMICMYIYICIQEYGLDIIYYTVYGLNFYSPPARWGLLDFITVVLLLLG